MSFTRCNRYYAGYELALNNGVSPIELYVAAYNEYMQGYDENNTTAEYFRQRNELNDYQTHLESILALQLLREHGYTVRECHRGGNIFVKKNPEE